MVERLTRATRGAAIAYLERRPYENVYLQWLVESGLFSYHDDGVMLWRNGTGTIGGAAYFGPQLVVATEDPRALDAFGTEARRQVPARMLVGEKTTADGMWERLRDWHRAPALVREHQPLYVLHPADLVAGVPVGVRQATIADAEIVVEHSARMILGELGYDPRRARTGFSAGVRGMIERGWWWVWIDGGRLRFMCNVGSRTAATAQVQGVWSPPEERGQGYATQGLGEIARRLLETNATLSLYVNDFNAQAIALYERIGFRRAGEFATYLFGP